MGYRYCNYCGIEYFAKRSSSKFCSNSCRTQNHQANNETYQLLNAKNGIDFQIKKANAQGMELACKQVNKKLKKLGYKISFGLYMDEEKGLIVKLKK